MFIITAITHVQTVFFFSQEPEQDSGKTIASVTPGDTNVFRLCLVVRVRPKIL